MIDAQLPAQNKSYCASFTITNGTQAKILADTTEAAVMAAVPNEVALPNEVSVRQRILTGGQRLIDGFISSTDGSARSLIIWGGIRMANFANLGAPTITSQNSINRTVGSFISDGWQVGDTLMGFGHTTGANNGVLGIVTTVNSSSLVVNGTPFTNETMPATYRLFRVAQKTRRGVPANSGNADSTPPVQFLGGSQDPTALPAENIGQSMGPLDVTIVGMTAAVSALPAHVDVTAIAVLY